MVSAREGRIRRAFQGLPHEVRGRFVCRRTDADKRHCREPSRGLEIDCMGMLELLMLAAMVDGAALHLLLQDGARIEVPQTTAEEPSSNELEWWFGSSKFEPLRFASRHCLLAC